VLNLALLGLFIFISPKPCLPAGLAQVDYLHFLAKITEIDFLDISM
jgi:hypothetical protein